MSSEQCCLGRGPWTAEALLPLLAKQPCCELASLTDCRIEKMAAFFSSDAPNNKEPDSRAVSAKAAAGLPHSKVTIFTLHPSPFTLHPSPFTLHPSPFTLPKKRAAPEGTTRICITYPKKIISSHGAYDAAATAHSAHRARRPMSRAQQ